jgi:beta-galactosidase
MVLSDARVSKGEMIFSQFTATQRYDSDSVAKFYLNNLMKYFSGNEVSEFAVELPEKSLAKVMHLNEKDALFIDLKKFVNRSFSDEKGGDRKGGWADFGSANDFSGIPTGKTKLQGGIPFDIIDPAENNDKSCIIMKGAKRDYFPEAVTGIPVNALLNNIYILHTSMHTGTGPVVKYILNYEDGRKTEFIAGGKNEIPDWWMPENKKNAIVVFRKGKKGLYVSDFINPLPKVKIKSIDILSCNNGVPAIIAITGRKRFTSVISGVGEK